VREREREREKERDLEHSIVSLNAASISQFSPWFLNLSHLIFTSSHPLKD
jgi:hypothetical protein